MSSSVSRRWLLTTAGALFAVFSGCLRILDSVTVQQPYGDILFRNHHTQYHELSVIATNHHVQAREREESGTKRFYAGLKAGSNIREDRFFVAGDTEVVVSVDDTVVEETRVEIWRGEGGDEDRHEESLIVTIQEDGIIEVAVRVTHTPPY